MKRSTLQVNHWSTDATQPSRRFDYCANALASSILPMKVSSEEPDRFTLDMSMADIGPVSVMRIAGSAHRAARGASEVSRSLENSYHLIVNLAAPCQLEHRGAIDLRQGDATFADSRFPYDFRLGPSFRHAHIKLSEQWVRQWLPHPAPLVGRTLPRDSGWARALTAFAAQLTPEFLVASPLPVSVVIDQVGALLALTANELGAEEGHVTVRDRRVADLVEDRIVERAGEPSLTASDVAGSLGISLRTLHRALAARATTFGAALIAARAGAAGRMLESPLMDRLTIEQVGMRAGFSDPSHFSRVMRRRFGRSPSQIRRLRGAD